MVPNGRETAPDGGDGAGRHAAGSSSSSSGLSPLVKHGERRPSPLNPLAARGSAAVAVPAASGGPLLPPPLLRNFSAPSHVARTMPPGIVGVTDQRIVNATKRLPGPAGPGAELQLYATERERALRTTPGLGSGSALAIPASPPSASSPSASSLAGSPRRHASSMAQAFRRLSRSISPGSAGLDGPLSAGTDGSPTLPLAAPQRPGSVPVGSPAGTLSGVRQVPTPTFVPNQLTHLKHAYSSESDTESDAGGRAVAPGPARAGSACSSGSGVGGRFGRHSAPLADSPGAAALSESYSEGERAAIFAFESHATPGPAVAARGPTPRRPSLPESMRMSPRPGARSGSALSSSSGTATTASGSVPPLPGLATPLAHMFQYFHPTRPGQSPFSTPPQPASHQRRDSGDLASPRAADGASTGSICSSPGLGSLGARWAYEETASPAAGAWPSDVGAVLSHALPQSAVAAVAAFAHSPGSSGSQTPTGSRAGRFAGVAGLAGSVPAFPSQLRLGAAAGGARSGAEKFGLGLGLGLLGSGGAVPAADVYRQLDAIASGDAPLANPLPLTPSHLLKLSTSCPELPLLRPSSSIAAGAPLSDAPADEPARAASFLNQLWESAASGPPLRPQAKGFGTIFREHSPRTVSASGEPPRGVRRPAAPSNIPVRRAAAPNADPDDPTAWLRLQALRRDSPAGTPRSQAMQLASSLSHLAGRDPGLALPVSGPALLAARHREPAAAEAVESGDEAASLAETQAYVEVLKESRTAKVVRWGRGLQGGGDLLWRPCLSCSNDQMGNPLMLVDALGAPVRRPSSSADSVQAPAAAVSSPLALRFSPVQRELARSPLGGRARSTAAAARFPAEPRSRLVSAAVTDSDDELALLHRLGSPALGGSCGGSTANAGSGTARFFFPRKSAVGMVLGEYLGSPGNSPSLASLSGETSGTGAAGTPSPSTLGLAAGEGRASPAGGGGHKRSLSDSDVGQVFKGFCMVRDDLELGKRDCDAELRKLMHELSDVHEQSLNLHEAASSAHNALQAVSDIEDVPLPGRSVEAAVLAHSEEDSPLPPFIAALAKLISIIQLILDLDCQALLEDNCYRQITNAILLLYRQWAEHPDWLYRKYLVRVLVVFSGVARRLEYLAEGLKAWGDGLSPSGAPPVPVDMAAASPEAGNGAEEDVGSSEAVAGDATAWPALGGGRASAPSLVTPMGPESALAVPPQETPAPDETDEPKQGHWSLQELRERADEGQSINILFTTDAHGVIRYISPVCRFVWGYEPHELVGQTMAAVVPDEAPYHMGLNNLFPEALDTLIRGRQHSTVEVQYCARRADALWLLMECKGMVLYDGAADGVRQIVWVTQPVSMLGNGWENVLGEEGDLSEEVLADDAGQTLRPTSSEEQVTSDEADNDPALEESLTVANNDILLCHICERSVPATLFESHSVLCAQVHRIEMQLHLVQDELVEARRSCADRCTQLGRGCKLLRQSRLLERPRPLCDWVCRLENSGVVAEYLASLQQRLESLLVISDCALGIEMPAQVDGDDEGDSEGDLTECPGESQRGRRSRVARWTPETIDMPPPLVSSSPCAMMDVVSRLRPAQIVYTGEGTESEGDSDAEVPDAEVAELLASDDTMLDFGEELASFYGEVAQLAKNKLVLFRELRSKLREHREHVIQETHVKLEIAYQTGTLADGESQSRADSVSASQGSASLAGDVAAVTNGEVVASPLPLGAALSPETSLRLADGLGMRQRLASVGDLVIKVDPEGDGRKAGATDDAAAAHPPGIATASPGRLRQALPPPRLVVSTKKVYEVEAFQAAVPPAGGGWDGLGGARRGSETTTSSTPTVTPVSSFRWLMGESQANSKRGSIVAAPGAPAGAGAVAMASFSRTQPSIKDFEIIKPISRGAFGSVFLAKKLLTGDYYAIKVLRKADMIAKNQVVNVKAERLILSQLDSRHVVKLCYTFQTRDHLYLVMEYLNGGDCAALIKAVGQLDEQWARQYIAEVVLGLEFLHSRGIIHRDLKPDNLLIDHAGHLKLTDFGLSRVGFLGRRGIPGGSSGGAALAAQPAAAPASRLSDAASSGSGGPASPSAAPGTARTSSLGGSAGASTLAGKPALGQSPSQVFLPAAASTTVAALALPSSSPAATSTTSGATPMSSTTTLAGGTAGPAMAGTPPLGTLTYHQLMHSPRRGLNSRRTSMASLYSSNGGENPPSAGSGSAPTGLPLGERGSTGSTTSAAAAAATAAAATGATSDRGARFLLEQQLEEDARRRRFVGTPDYLAPESILGLGQDAAVDWWALGVILYEFLSGTPPFNAPTAQEVFANILGRAIDWAPEGVEFSPEARDLMERLLCVNPQERLGSRGAAEIKEHAWFRDVDWGRLLEQDGAFVPRPEHAEDTAYFDDRGASAVALGGDSARPAGASGLAGRLSWQGSQGSQDSVNEGRPRSQSTRGGAPAGRLSVSGKVDVSSGPQGTLAASSSFSVDLAGGAPGPVSPSGPGGTDAPQGQSGPTGPPAPAAGPGVTADAASNEWGEFVYRNLHLLEKANADILEKIKSTSRAYSISSDGSAAVPGARRSVAAGSPAAGRRRRASSSLSQPAQTRLAMHGASLAGAAASGHRRSGSLASVPAALSAELGSPSGAGIVRTTSPAAAIGVQVRENAAATADMLALGAMVDTAVARSRRFGSSTVSPVAGSPAIGGSGDLQSSSGVSAVAVQANAEAPILRPSTPAGSLALRTAPSHPLALRDVQSTEPTPSTPYPVPRTPAAAPAPSNVEQLHAHRPLDVLVADDNPISCKIMEAMLSKLNCWCVVVRNGAEAVRCAMGEVKFDVILMDVLMPILDGQDATRLIKAFANINQHTFIVAITAYEHTAQLSAQFDDVLLKPVTRDVLIQVLLAVLRNPTGSCSSLNLFEDSRH